MNIQPFHDPETGTLSYVVSDEATQECAIIDSVLNYEPQGGSISYKSASNIIHYIEAQKLKVVWILETHIHADHLTAAQYLKDKLGGKVGISEHVKEVSEYWRPIFGLPLIKKPFDHLFTDGERFSIGQLNVEIMHTPGHTPACACYKINQVVFVGDTLFKPQSGTSRADFPGGSADTLYHSIQKILSLPDETKLYLCHDYPQNNASFEYKTTVQAQKQNNSMINERTTLNEFKEKRSARDKTLAVPKLLLPALQVNLLGGKLPFAEPNGKPYLKVPLTGEFKASILYKDISGK